MGVQQSSVREGLQFCSTNVDPLAERFMADRDFRVGYISSKRNMEKDQSQFEAQMLKHNNEQGMTMNRSNGQYVFHKSVKHVHQQQKCSTEEQQQKQEDVHEKATNGHAEVAVTNDKVENVEAVKFIEEGLVYEGVFGDVTLKNGFITYSDRAGREFHGVFDAQTLQKTFPMGISFGGPNSILWFKDIRGRDECFDKMTGNLPPSYAEVMRNPAKYIPYPDKTLGETKAFDGIQGYDVIVHPNSSVSYTDIDGEYHCASYNSHKIQKCFPHGICFGGLPRTIWLKDEIERDLCYVMMQMTRNTKTIEKPSKEKAFEGLYGSVILKSYHEVDYTSLVGGRVNATWYNPQMIRRVFPMGITGGGLPSTIWFEEAEEMENCIEAMQGMC